MINIARSAARNILRIGRITKLARDATKVATTHVGYYTQSSENNGNRPGAEDLPLLPLHPSEIQQACTSIQASTVEEAVEDIALRRR